MAGRVDLLVEPDVQIAELGIDGADDLAQLLDQSRGPALQRGITLPQRIAVRIADEHITSVIGRQKRHRAGSRSGQIGSGHGSGIVLPGWCCRAACAISFRIRSGRTRLDPPQCDISAGSVIRVRISLVTPPRMSSRSLAWP